MLYLIAGLVVLVALYIWYTNIISRRNKVQEALSSIDVQLQQRSDLIPNILKLAKKYLEHERELFSEITRLRSKVGDTMQAKDASTLEQHFSAANQLSGKMGQFMIQLENYPELKSNETMLQAQRSYNEVEAQISAARRFYNSAVNNLRNAIQIFPGTLLIGLTDVTDMPMYEADAVAHVAIDADSYLK